MNIYQPNKILVTGSAGFIGTNFVHYILKNDPQVNIISLDKLTYAGNKKNLDNLPDATRHIFVQGDICDRSLVDQLLRKHQIDTVVHFAAETHVDRSIIDPSDFVQTNVIGTFTLLEATKHYWLYEKKMNHNQCRFHHISTDEVYGELQLNDPPFTEDSPYQPSSPYSASKAGSDHLVKSYFRTYGLPITISNSSNNYGQFQHSEKLIPTIIGCCIEQKPIPIYGNGTNIRDWLYTEDHCEAIWAILQKGIIGETYNIGGNSEIDNLSLAKMICKIIDNKKPHINPHEKLIIFTQDRKGHDFRYAIDTTKINNILAWQKKHSLQEGLLKTINYYLQNMK